VPANECKGSEPLHNRCIFITYLLTYLLTDCSKKLFNNYAEGTKFKLKAKLTDGEGEGPFLYSYFGWKPLEIIES
jgi:hypothetical protein